MKRWDLEAMQAKEARTREFYEKTERVRVVDDKLAALANAVGKPQQMRMV
jgi:hypothetical protein